MKNMLKSLCLLVTALTIAWLAPGLCAAQAAQDDSGIKGLWITAPGFVKQSEFVDVDDKNPDGPASYTRSMNGGSLFMTIERLEPIEYGEDAIKAEIPKWMQGGVSDLKVWQDEDLSALYTYPAFRADYTFGSNEDTTIAHELIIYTDPFTFRVSVTIDADYAGGYTDDEFDPKWIDEWFSGLEMRE